MKKKATTKKIAKKSKKKLKTTLKTAKKTTPKKKEQKRVKPKEKKTTMKKFKVKIKEKPKKVAKKIVAKIEKKIIFRPEKKKVEIKKITKKPEKKVEVKKKPPLKAIKEVKPRKIIEKPKKKIEIKVKEEAKKAVKKVEAKVELKKPVIEEKYPPTPWEILPAEYGEDSIALMTVDPNKLFTYWEVREDTLAMHEGNIDVRVYDVTGVEFDGTNANSYFDIAVSERIGSRYIGVSPEKEFITDMGIINIEGILITTP